MSSSDDNSDVGDYDEVEKTYIDDDEVGDDDDTVPHLVSAAVHLSTDGAALLLAVTCLFNASWQELLDRHILNHVHAQLMYSVSISARER